MSDALTPYLGLTKPAVGGSNDTWGDKENADNDLIDANASSVNDLIVALTARVTALETAVTAEAIGTVKWWPTGGNFPAGSWQACDGTLFNVATYPALAAVLGHTWGGDGISTFGVPDMRGCVPVGADAGTGRLAGQYPGGIGSVGGVATIALTTAQMPSHAHGGVTDEQGGHMHGAVFADFQTPGNWVQGASGTQLARVYNQTDSAGTHEHAVYTDWQGGGAGFGICQPGAVGTWIIRMAMP
jgi:microcystin-dependent protein